MNPRKLSILIASIFVLASVTNAASNAQTPPPAAAAPPSASIDAASRKAVIETAIAKMTESYVFPEKVPAIAKVLHAGLAGKYRRLSDAQAFVDAVNADIEAAANDRHLRLRWSADPLPPPPDPDKIDPAMRKQFTEFIARRNYAIRRAEVLDGNMGYLKINGFLPPEMAGGTLSAAMAFLKNSDALIIDLRDNGGGDPQGVAMLVSYVVYSETLINTSTGAATPWPSKSGRCPMSRADAGAPTSRSMC